MKIAFDAKRFFNNASGLGNYSRDLIRILSEYFPENLYFLLNKNQSERGKEILNSQNVLFVKTSNGNFSRQLKMGKDAQNVEAHIFHGLSGELPLQWNQKPIKKVVTIHDLIFMRYPKFYPLIERKIHLWKFRKAAKIADLIIVISEQTKKDLLHYLNVSESKIRVVYQGCHESFKQISSQEFLYEIQSKFKLPERFVLNVGTIEERKNLLNIIKALQETQIPLVVVGKKQKKYFKKIKKELQKNRVDVQFLEDVSMQELAAIYRLADVFIYPSLYEGFGIPVIEALFSETPVITSNLSSLPEAGGKNSLYVDPKNVEDIKAKILFLWYNESERKRRAEKSLEHAQKFQDEKIAHDLMRIYKEVLS